MRISVREGVRLMNASAHRPLPIVGILARVVVPMADRTIATDKPMHRLVTTSHKFHVISVGSVTNSPFAREW